MGDPSSLQLRRDKFLVVFGVVLLRHPSSPPSSPLATTLRLRSVQAQEKKATKEPAMADKKDEGEIMKIPMG